MICTTGPFTRTRSVLTAETLNVVRILSTDYPRGTGPQILAGQAANPGDRGSDADSTFEALQPF